MAINFQSKAHKFPKKGYMAGIWLRDRDGKVVSIYFFIGFYSNLAECIKQMEVFSGKESTKDLDTYVKDHILVIPLHLKKLFKLKKDYWYSPAVNYNVEKRTDVFHKMLPYLEDYEILVTPNVGEDTFSIPFAFPKGDDQAVDLFASASDWPVDPEAKFIGIYTPGDTFGLNIKTGEKIDNEKKKLVN